MAIPQGIQRWNFGGGDLTTYMMEILTERGKTLTTSCDREVARETKESVCYVAEDFNKEMDLVTSNSYNKNQLLDCLKDDFVDTF
jgi:actin beta/gamma 1